MPNTATPPTLWSVARRPKFLGLLGLVLLVAGIFAGLAQWQLDRSFSNGAVVVRDTETVRPLVELDQPQAGVDGDAIGHRVTVRGHLVPGDEVVLTRRVQGEELGAWVVGHLAVEQPDGEPASLAVALGWAPTEGQAQAAADALEDDTTVREWAGRYTQDEGPQESDFEAGERRALSTGELVNLWAEVEPAGAYGGYLIAADAPTGLDAILSPAPESERGVNLQNLAYFAQWIFFGLFAFYIWYRMVKDAWQEEIEPDRGGGEDADAPTETASAEK